MIVDIGRDLGRLGDRVLARLTAVAVELDVGDMGAVIARTAHGLQRRRVIAGMTQIVAVDMGRMREAELARDLD